MDKVTETKAKVSADAPVDETAPPPYTPFAGESAASSSNIPDHASLQSFEQQVPICPSISPHHPIPAKLDAYYQIKLTRTYHLGEDTNTKLFAISNYAGKGISSKSPDRPCVVIHNGADAETPALAVAGEEKGWTLQSLVSIVTLPGVVDTKPLTELMHTSILDDRETVVHRFSIEVGQPGQFRRENFEWRRMAKNEMEDYKNSWKLIRLSIDGGGSDHGSTVATAGWKSMISITKPFSFRLADVALGSQLGDRWAIMALATALRIWFMDVQGRVSSRAVAAASR